MMNKLTLAVTPSSHLDLFWLGNYKTCLERGAHIIRQYIERCLEHPDETFFIETTVFTDYFCRRHPELVPALKQLVAEGRIEIGTAYVDRWETLVPAESLIRNVQIGKAYCQAMFDIDNPVVTHPDLPSMTPQIAQIYRQANIDFYVTSRKVFRNGQVWRYRSPDGSKILVLNWPRHYVFVLMDYSDAPGDTGRKLWTTPIDLEETRQGFPLGTINISGSAGDLSDRKDFEERYGQQLEDYIALFRSKYPENDFCYTIPSRVLTPYLEVDELPVLTGQIPSVWGVAADEEATFFQRNRKIEGQLLTAETLAVVASSLGVAWRPDEADDWQGVYYEGAFFGEKDPILRGQEWEALWRMHIFTQDHNGGGQEGALSTFQKRTMQNRCLDYTDQIISTVLEGVASRLRQQGQKLLVFNPHGQGWADLGGEPVCVPTPADWQKDDGLIDSAGKPVLIQQDALGSLYLLPEAIPAVGYRSYRRVKDGNNQTASPTAAITTTTDRLKVENRFMRLSVDLRSGSLAEVIDLASDRNWGSPSLGRLSVLEESGNDVTLRIVPDSELVEDTLESVRVTESGSLFTRIEVRKRLLKCTVEQQITIWNHEPRFDLHTRIYWWGARNRQVRLHMPGGERREDITCGMPFYGAAWSDTASGTAPYNSDEISPEDQMAYREVLGWLHLRQGEAGLAVFTSHPAFQQSEGTLRAVLLRTAPSCGDRRLYWENAGEQNFHFVFKFAQPDWQSASVPHQAEGFLRPPATRWVEGGGAEGGLPDTYSVLQITDGAILSALYPSHDRAVLRVWNPSEKQEKPRIAGRLAQGGAQQCNFLETPSGQLDGQLGGWELDLPPWAIRTLILDTENLSQ